MNMLFALINFFLFIVFLVILYRWLFPTKKMNLPPSPPKLPIIGHLHKLGKFPHRSLRALSIKYGEFMMLYFGNRPTLVVSSAYAAEEIMKTHDLVFANRPHLRFVNRIFYDGEEIGFNSYNETWRQLKGISVMELLSKNRVQSFRTTREEEVAQLIEKIKSYGGSAFNLSETFFTLMKGLICRSALGRKYSGIDGDDTEFFKLLKELIEVIGTPSVGDYIPMLSWVDKLTGLEGKVENVRKKFDDFMEEVVSEHQNRLNAKHGYTGEKDDKSVKDFVQVLLQIQRDNPKQLSTKNIKGVILDIFVGGTETITTTLEWAMTELLRHPEVMKRLQEELRGNAKTNTRVSEDDLQNMNYLKAVLKETLRLHPPASLLAFHESSKDVKVDKYDIARQTQVIINALAIQHDPERWQDPEVFNPERFLNISSSITFTGQHFEFIPFGAGRRRCPGSSYAIITAEIVLASLVYEFNWSLLNGRDGKTLDVEEGVGLAIGRRNPLMVIASPN